jgi:hypothetical protein
MPRAHDGYDPVTKQFTWNSFDSGGGFQTTTYTIEGTMVSFSGTQQVGGKQAKVRGTSVLAPDFKSNVQRIEVSVLNPAPRLGGSSADAARSETADAADDEFGVFRSPAMIAVWPQAGRLHRGGRVFQGRDQSGRGRDPVSGRDRRLAAFLESGSVIQNGDLSPKFFEERETPPPA